MDIFTNFIEAMWNKKLETTVWPKQRTEVYNVHKHSEHNNDAAETFTQLALFCYFTFMKNHLFSSSEGFPSTYLPY